MNERLFIFAFAMRKRDDNKEHSIREKALTMFVKDGFDGFSMQKLAKAAGISPATIYIYFKDKEDLILQLSAEQIKKMADITLDGFKPSMSFSEGLRIQWMNRARYCMEHPNEMQFLEQIRNSPFHEKTSEMIGENFKNIMKEFVTKAIERNELAKVPVEVFWSVAYGPLYNLVKFHMNGRSIGGNQFSFTEDMMNQTLGLVLKALKP
jgi:TetR/AcrR family transcriptional regulator, multidrug resistance operon repressor